MAIYDDQILSNELVQININWATSVDLCDGYYVAYKPITLSCILFMFIEIKFIHCHSRAMFEMKSNNMQFHALISCILCISSLKYNHKYMLS